MTKYIVKERINIRVPKFGEVNLKKGQVLDVVFNADGKSVVAKSADWVNMTGVIIDTITLNKVATPAISEISTTAISTDTVPVTKHKYKLKKDFVANTFYNQNQKPGDPLRPMMRPLNYDLTRLFKKGDVVEGVVNSQTIYCIKAPCPSIPQSLAVEAEAKPSLRKATFIIPMDVLEKIEDATKTGEVAKTDATAKKIDWKKVGIGAVIGILILLVLAYLMGKRDKKGMITAGVMGALIGGLFAHFGKSKAI
jgi:hypothetical protein